MQIRSTSSSGWTTTVATIVLAVVAFVVTIIVDLMAIDDRLPLKVVPALAVSILFLLVGQTYNQHKELERVTKHSTKTYEAVKNRLHVIRLGTPQKALEHISNSIPSLIEVRNTVLNIKNEATVADERLYDSTAYDTLELRIGGWISKGLRWKDIGDSTSVERFRKLDQLASGRVSSDTRYRYQYKLLKHEEPQMNFIVLNYANGDAEVLFNWDYRSRGQDPRILLSRDPEIVEMMTVHYDVMWDHAVEDHDRIATKSTS